MRSAKSGCRATTSVAATGAGRRRPGWRSAPQLRSPLGEGSHTEGSAVKGAWLRTGDLGVYLDGELYVTGRIADLITIDGRNHYPQDIETTAAEASPIVRRGYVTAFSVPNETGQGLVIIAERAAGTSRADPEPAIEAIRASRVQTGTA